jgi:hypothetical protein
VQHAGKLTLVLASAQGKAGVITGDAMHTQGALRGQWAVLMAHEVLMAAAAARSEHTWQQCLWRRHPLAAGIKAESQQVYYLPYCTAAVLHMRHSASFQPVPHIHCLGHAVQARCILFDITSTVTGAQPPYTCRLFRPYNRYDTDLVAVRVRPQLYTYPSLRVSYRLLTGLGGRARGCHQWLGGWAGWDFRQAPTCRFPHPDAHLVMPHVLALLVVDGPAHSVRY